MLLLHRSLQRHIEVDINVVVIMEAIMVETIIRVEDSQDDPLMWRNTVRVVKSEDMSWKNIHSNTIIARRVVISLTIASNKSGRINKRSQKGMMATMTMAKKPCRHIILHFNVHITHELSPLCIATNLFMSSQPFSVLQWVSHFMYL